MIDENTLVWGQVRAPQAPELQRQRSRLQSPRLFLGSWHAMASCCPRCQPPQAAAARSRRQKSRTPHPCLGTQATPSALGNALLPAAAPLAYPSHPPPPPPFQKHTRTRTRPDATTHAHGRDQMRPRTHAPTPHHITPHHTTPHHTPAGPGRLAAHPQRAHPGAPDSHGGGAGGHLDEEDVWAEAGAGARAVGAPPPPPRSLPAGMPAGTLASRPGGLGAAASCWQGRAGLVPAPGPPAAGPGLGPACRLPGGTLLQTACQTLASAALFTPTLLLCPHHALPPRAPTTTTTITPPHHHHHSLPHIPAARSGRSSVPGSSTPRWIPCTEGRHRAYQNPEGFIKPLNSGCLARQCAARAPSEGQF